MCLVLHIAPVQQFDPGKVMLSMKMFVSVLTKSLRVMTVWTYRSSTRNPKFPTGMSTHTGGPTFLEFCNTVITEGCGGGRRIRHSIRVFRWLWCSYDVKF
jgi:hypothetical protein